jgi:hypothetical protein
MRRSGARLSVQQVDVWESVAINRPAKARWHKSCVCALERCKQFQSACSTERMTESTLQSSHRNTR